MPRGNLKGKLAKDSRKRQNVARDEESQQSDPEQRSLSASLKSKQKKRKLQSKVVDVRKVKINNESKRITTKSLSKGANNNATIDRTVGRTRSMSRDKNSDCNEGKQNDNDKTSRKCRNSNPDEITGDGIQVTVNESEDDFQSDNEYPSDLDELGYEQSDVSDQEQDEEQVEIQNREITNSNNSRNYNDSENEIFFKVPTPRSSTITKDQ